MSDMNLEQARSNMVKQQIQPWDVRDEQVLEILSRVHREDFVPEQYKNSAYTDMTIPLAHAEVMMEPKNEARMLQSLDIKDDETVLEIGTGSGYITALLARLARHVYSVDIHEDFISEAKAKLDQHHIYNVTLQQGDAAQSWSDKGPFDAIAITGSLPVLPVAFEQSLKVGGRLFVITGDAPIMQVNLITRVSKQEFSRSVLFETLVPALQNAIQPERFQL